MYDRDCHAGYFVGGHENKFLPRRVFAGLEPLHSDPEQAKVVIVPVPYDSTSEWRSGSRHGPQAVIDASQYLELYDLELDREIHKCGICTLPEIEPVLSSPQDMIDRVYHVVRGLIQKEKFVVLLGGEHSLSLGAVRACREAFANLTVLQLDAHADLRDEYLGTRYGQACVMRRILELCRISQVGIRSLSWEEKQFLKENQLTPLYMSALAVNEAAVNQIVDSLSEDVYITVDADVLDPSIMPAVGMPEPGGMSWQQLWEILRAVTISKHVIGLDFMEFCPAEGPRSCAFLLAKLVYKAIGYAVRQEGR